MHAWVLFEMQIPRTHPQGFWIQQLSAHQWALTVRMWPHRNVRFPSNTRRETVLENAWSRVPSCKQRHWLLNSQDNGKITDFQEARETGLGGSISRTHPNHSAALVWWEGGAPSFRHHHQLPCLAWCDQFPVQSMGRRCVAGRAWVTRPRPGTRKCKHPAPDTCNAGSGPCSVRKGTGCQAWVAKDSNQLLCNEFLNRQQNLLTCHRCKPVNINSHTYIYL